MKRDKDLYFRIVILVAIVAIVAIVAMVFFSLNSQDYSAVISQNSSIIGDCVLYMDSSITGGLLVSCPNFEVRGGTVVRR